MKTTLYFLLAIGLLAAACNNNNNDGPKALADKTDSPKNYLPVLDFIREDIVRVDSFGGAILVKTSIDSKKDSSYTDLPGFIKSTADFLPSELEIASFQKNYKESSFVDESSQVVNFMYTPNDVNAKVQKVVLYVPPSLGTDKVNRVYMEKVFKRGDTLINQKLTWKMRSYFIIAENRQTPDGKNSISTYKAIWDARLFMEE